MRGKAKLVLFMIMALLMAAPVAFAAKVEWVTAPATDDEKAAAQLALAFVDAHGGSYATMAELLTDNVQVCCFKNIGNLEPEYKSKMNVGLLFTGSSISQKHVYDLAVKVNGGGAEVSGVYNYTVSKYAKETPLSFVIIWQLRKDGGSYRIYKIAMDRR